MKNNPIAGIDGEPAETAVQVGEESGAPVIARCQCHFERPEFHSLPVVELMHNVKAEVMHQIAHTNWHDNRLVSGHLAQGSAIEMIEMRMGDENEIDLRQMMNFKAGLLETLDYL